MTNFLGVSWQNV